MTLLVDRVGRIEACPICLDNYNVKNGRQVTCRRKMCTLALKATQRKHGDLWSARQLYQEMVEAEELKTRTPALFKEVTPNAVGCCVCGRKMNTDHCKCGRNRLTMVAEPHWHDEIVQGGKRYK